MTEPNYEYWEKALADPKALHAREFVITTEPQPGFYRTRYGRPVAIWTVADMILMRVGDGETEPANDDVWTRVARFPVTEEDYEAVLAGGEWPDRDEVIRQTLGLNIADTTDRDTLEAMLMALAEQATKYHPIEDDDAAKRAMSIRNRMNELALRADKLRKAEKEPHLAAGKAVDEIWMPLVKSANDTAQGLARSAARYETAKLQAKQAQEREQAKRRQDELDRQRAAGQEPDPFGLPPIPQKVEPVQDQIRPGYGKAASVKVKKVVVGIDDVMTVVAQFRDNADLIALLTKIAQRAIDDGHEVLGVAVEDQAFIR